jgi:hypothetical protein
VQGGRDEIVNPQEVERMARRLNQQRHVEIDFAMIEDGDHMYNDHLKDLYKVVGQYVISAIRRRSAMKAAPKAILEQSAELSDEAVLPDDDFEDEA